MLKHIFWVHSHITYLVTTTIIKHFNIDNAVILLTRNYTVPYTTNVRIFNFPYYYTPSQSKHLMISKFNIARSIKSIRNCNKLINEITNNKKFILYIPLYNQPPIRCLIEHYNCQKFYYIEEGAASYRPIEYFGKKSFVKKIKGVYYKILPYSKLLGGEFFDKNHLKFDGTYSFFNDTFPWNSNKRYVLPFNPINKIKKIEADAFLFFDALVEFGFVSINTFLKVLNDVIKFLILKGYKKVSFKFHPEQIKASNNKKRIIDLFNKYSNSIIFNELDRDFIAESYFLQYKSTILIFLSSIGIYARKCNSEVITLISFFKMYDIDFYNKFKERL